MAGSMKDIKLRIKSVESTMQITKAMELVASSKMRRAKERVEHSRPYFETLYASLTKIAAADPRARNPYLRRDEIKRTLLIVIAGDRGLAGGYNANIFKQADAHEGPVTVLPIGKRAAEHFAQHGAELFTQEVLLAADISVGECFQLSRSITEGFLKGEYDAVKICYTRFDSMMTQTATTLEAWHSVSSSSKLNQFLKNEIFLPKAPLIEEPSSGSETERFNRSFNSPRLPRSP